MINSLVIDNFAPINYPYFNIIKIKKYMYNCFVNLLSTEQTEHVKEKQTRQMFNFANI